MLFPRLGNGYRRQARPKQIPNAANHSKVV